MVTKWLNRALIVAGLWVLTTTGASALTLQVVGQGLWATTNQNYGCLTGSANCLSSADFTLGSPAAATGTIDINPAGTIATINLQVASSTFLGPSLSTITFAGASYTASMAISTFGSSYFQNGAASGAVSGTANLNAFAVLPSITNFNCTLVLGAGQCGLTYGFTGGFANVQAHDWVHTFNLNVVALPEPSSALLVALGVAGLLIRSRRA